MSKKIIILPLLLLCALIIYARITPSALAPTQNQPIESTLKFIPDEIRTNAGQNNEISIQVNSKGKNPTLLQFEIAYDPTALTEIKLTKKKPFTNAKVLLNNNDQKNGRISYAISLSPNAKPLSSSAIPVTLKFKVKENTTHKQTTLFFLPKTAVLSNGINIPLKIAYGAKILISTPVKIYDNP